MDSQGFSKSDPRVYTTVPDNPEEGRVFVYAITHWYERMSGDQGEIVFQHITDQEKDLNDYIGADWPTDGLTELDPPDDDFARMVAREFVEQWPLYPYSEDDSEESPAESRTEIESTFMHHEERNAGQR